MDQLLKGRCEHGAWWLLIDAGVDRVDSWMVTCPFGCEILLRPINLDE